jgi:hypothetical protein
MSKRAEIRSATVIEVVGDGSETGPKEERRGEKKAFNYL